MTAVLFGEWARFQTWVKKVKYRAVGGDYASDVESIAAWIVGAIQGHIDNQDLGWAELQPRTIARKGHATIYLETGEYRNSIKARLQKAGRFSLVLQVSPEGTHSQSGLSMDKLARHLEFGTSKMYARPLWRPVLEELKYNEAVGADLRKILEGFKF